MSGSASSVHFCAPPQSPFLLTLFISALCLAPSFFARPSNAFHLSAGSAASLGSANFQRSEQLALKPLSPAAEPSGLAAPAAFVRMTKCTYTAASPGRHAHLRRAGALDSSASALWAARRGFVGGNWKCNGTTAKTQELVDMLNSAPVSFEQVDVVVAPPSLFISQVQDSLRQPRVQVAAQDSSTQQAYGAFTGELSPKMIKEKNIPWVVLGHSERRAGFGGQPGESNQVVAKKVRAALNEGLSVILCIGETLEERESGQTQKVLSEQLEAVRQAVPEADAWKSIVIAYEPVWAIGTGKTATAALAQETHRDIRNWLAQAVSPKVAEATRVIYGGSVKGSNAKELFEGEDVDGFLVGGASLTGDFVSIIDAAKQQA
ncbi:triose-phosphate isomerase TPI-II [Toxoplasma gondii GT1]|uniref:Triosephosphate isomerase n=7 Tax=Toxoplasma gondii TaxID=5811 RepID=S7V3N4_TOXGG|nr:triose-phosphate isomerase TPI-II [Toxoplasma gondii GT1]KAF4641937.1 triose-phosphate isomerase TPI-II [Toxoplasma gondii]KFG51364.1 triose-phosphate isomerase TPI-II [Toxoplasma gondii p89]